jgi:outer membrane lipoprotein-sorting protein
MKTLLWIVAAALVVSAASADTAPPDAQTILAHVLDSDPWGLNGASSVAHATTTDKGGAKSELTFTARSKRLGPGLAASIVRFSSPPEFAGAGFLQIQKSDDDDERFLFLPDLKRSRRISGSLRSNAFMGTDLSFADLDRRDLRESTVTLNGSETIEKWECYVLDVVPKLQDSQYSHQELWVRKDNFVPLRIKFYDRSRALMKTFRAMEIRRISGQWFISKSKLTNERESHTTDFVLERIATGGQFDDDEFTVRSLEKYQ